jgi:hypothetical protein
MSQAAADEFQRRLVVFKENRELACILGASTRTAQDKALRINK